MSQPWQQFLHSQRLRLSYWTWGDPANVEGKPPLLLIHGFRDQARSWDQIAEAFCDDYHVIALDHRGHGDSEWARGATYPLTDYMLDVVNLVDHVGGRASVIAHSMGGRVTLMAAGAHPERFEQIVAIEGTGRPRASAQDHTPTPRRLREWSDHTRGLERRQPHVYPTFEDAVARVREVNRRLTPEMAAHLARWAAHGVDGGWVWKYDPWLYADGGLEVRWEEMPAIWANIECAVLHIISSEGEALRSMYEGKPVESYFKHGSAVHAPDSGHWVHHDQTAFVIDAARGFLRKPAMAPQPGNER